MADQKHAPNQRWAGPYLYQVPALEGLCDDGRNGWTDASKHHQVVRSVFYCIVEGFQPFCIITLGSNTQKEKSKLETVFPRGKSPTVDSRKQNCLWEGFWVLVLPSWGFLRQPRAHAVSPVKCDLGTPALPPRAPRRPPNPGPLAPSLSPSERTERAPQMPHTGVSPFHGHLY